MKGSVEPDFSTWVTARGGALQRFAYLVTGSADEAPDFVQEALSRAYRAARSSRALAPMSTVPSPSCGSGSPRRRPMVDNHEATDDARPERD